MPHDDHGNWLGLGKGVRPIKNEERNECERNSPSKHAQHLHRGPLIHSVSRLSAQRHASAARQTGDKFAYANLMTVWWVCSNDEMDSPCQGTGIIVPPELFGMEESTS